MKKLLKTLGLLLCVMMLAVPAAADDVEEEVLLEDDGTTAPGALPVDQSAGFVPAEENFTEDSYEDASISVKMEKVTTEAAVFCVARVKIADASQLRTFVQPKRDNLISSMAKNMNAVVAVGGDYFRSDKGGYIIRQGEVIERRGKKAYETRDLLCIDEKGDFHILLRVRDAKKDGKSKSINPDFDEQLKQLKSEHTLVNVFEWGPALVIDGEKQEIPDSYSGNLSHREPRCAIGQTGPLEYVLVVVDTVKHHDRSGKEGANGEELAQFMADLGCTQAYNLDGGNSALMVFHGQNYSDKKLSEERSVSDIIYFATAVNPE